MNKESSPPVHLGKAFAALALKVGVASTNSACRGIYHQNKVPAAMNKLKK